MNQRFLRLMALPALLIFLAGCSLPRGAALQSEILSKTEIDQEEFAVYVVDRALLPKVAKWPRTGGIRSDGWISRRKGPASLVIAAGDRLNLAIWDSNTNSLLTAPEQKNVAMNEVVVSSDGTIFVPYLDRIYVSGMTPDKARETIQTQLEVIIASAQVQLAQTSGRRNSVDLVGGVAKAGNYPLPDRDFTVLGLISLGGGIPKDMRNPRVRLLRGGKIYVASVAQLYANPELDTTIRGGDKVIVSQDSRYFLSLGATGTESQFYFESDRVSALDALSMIGGISDSRGDPQGILILREYSQSVVDSKGAGPKLARAIFTIDLTSADGLFSAGQFQINPGDLVLATESPVNSVQKIFSLIGSVVGISNRL
jgi:polysaccharide biosynthesis/export protein